MTAACHRCGAAKAGPFVPCKACGFVPTGDERPVAWLFSRGHLDADELVVAAARVRDGARPDPSRAQRAAARRAMGAPAVAEGGAPLRPVEWAWVGGGSVLLTPLVGLAAFVGWRDARPRAARQAVGLAAGGAVLGGLLWVWLVWQGRVGGG